MTSAILEPVFNEEATLRPLTKADLPSTLAWRNHEDSRLWFHSTESITQVQHDDWFARYLDRDNDYVFILELAGEPVAQSAIYDVADNAAEFGRLLVDPAKRGLGLSHRAIALSLRVADELLLLTQVHLEVKSSNARAIRAYEAAGFRRDSTRTGHDGSLVMVRTIP